jgi:hypothetical protein
LRRLHGDVADFLRKRDRRDKKFPSSGISLPTAGTSGLISIPWCVPIFIFFDKNNFPGANSIMTVLFHKMFSPDVQMQSFKKVSLF